MSSRRLLWLCMLSGVLPDADVIGFKFGVAYGDALGHRGFSHSLLFAVLWSLALTFVAFRKREDRLVAFFAFFLSTFSHGLIDALTNGGLGVGFFIPFDNRRFFFPWRPIQVSPILIGRFLERAQLILSNECLWLGVPCLVILTVLALLRNGRLLQKKRTRVE